MEALVRSLESILGEKHQWVVPVYQRHYEWESGEDEQIPTLWDDLREKALEKLEERNQYPHYIGAIIFAEPQSQSFGVVRKRFLVDGQQRITTFQLVLAALRAVAIDNDFAELATVIDSYIYNEKSDSMEDKERERFKLWSSSYDRKLFQTIIQYSPNEIREKLSGSFYKNGNLQRGAGPPNLLKAYWYLYTTIKTFVDNWDSENDEPQNKVAFNALLSSFLTGFQIVLIQLDPNDDAQEIFASLNGLGKPLSPFDLIRNDVFHRARKTGEDDEKLFDERWKSFEEPFWNEHVKQGRMKRARADHLVAHSVIAETVHEVNVGKIAAEYQRYAREREFETVAAELDVLLVHARTYRSMEEGEKDLPLSRISKILKTWDLSTFHPFILWVNAQSFEDEEKIRLFDILESYIIRREICGFTTKNYNKVSVALIKNIEGKDAPAQSLLEYINSTSGFASKMPNNGEISSKVESRNIYDDTATPRLRFILQEIELHNRDKFDEVEDLPKSLTIEHIMPRKWAEFWPLEDGSVAPNENIYEAFQEGHEISEEMRPMISTRNGIINTLGNLTLLTQPLNSSVSNGPWINKKEYFGNSLLAINRDVANYDDWSEVSIKNRAEVLSLAINEIWKA